MSVVEKAEGGDSSFPSIDVSWQNIAFSLRTAAAAILALALAYWLELSDPQWATLTVYILAQATVGAALAKGVWRAIGTVAGGLIGLVLVALFSQAPELLVAATVLLVGASFYAAARLRNYTSHGALLAGYTMLLVAFEGSTHPLNAWSIAVDRTTEILIGITCGTLASMIILPRYAGDALREAQANTFSRLARYVAAALRLSTPAAIFARRRRQMVAEVVSFDALCSFTLFEIPELRTDEELVRRTVRQFLIVLSIARGLVIRLEEFDNDDAQKVAGSIARDAGSDRGADRTYCRRSVHMERPAPSAPRDLGGAGRAEEHRDRARRHGRSGAVRSTFQWAADLEPRQRSSSRPNDGRHHWSGQSAQSPHDATEASAQATRLPGPAGGAAAWHPRRARGAGAQHLLDGNRLERRIYCGLGGSDHAVLCCEPGQSPGWRAHLSCLEQRRHSGRLSHDRFRLALFAGL